MRNRYRWFFVFLATLVLLTWQVSALSLKARPDVVFATGPITIGEIAVISPVSDAKAIASLSAGMVVQHPTVFSPAGIVSRIDKAIEGNFAYSGGPLLVAPQSLKDSRELPFLVKLMAFVSKEIEAPYDRLEIIAAQGLPLVHGRDSVEFFIGNSDPETFEVLYRISGRSSYRRSGVEIRKTQITQAPVLPAAVKPWTGRVRSGEKVSVVFVSGMIEAEFQGSALESGEVADIIQVKIDETGKVLDARITGRGEVRVEY